MHWNVQNLRALIYFLWAKTCSEHVDSLLAFPKVWKMRCGISNLPVKSIKITMIILVSLTDVKIGLTDQN